jgi:FAD:protein FMN transferase
MPSSRKSNRREFLKGHSAADALPNVADHLGEPLGDDSNSSGVALPEPERAGYLLRIGRRAMACEFEVLLNARQYPQGMEAAVAALDLVDELEAQLTVYRDSSEVSRLNQTAHMAPVEVESRLFDLLAKAAQIHRETGGAYDITSGPLSKAWGFYRRAGQMPSDLELSETMRQIGMQHLQFDAQRRTVGYDQRGVEINLGSIGKGYALDRAADSLLASGIENFLLHGGNSSVLARGSSGNPQAEPEPVDEETVESAPNTNGWWIGLRHPLLPRRRIGEIRLRDGAIGTSGSGTQFFVHNGRRYGHILDPRTGRPAEGTLSITVVAGTGAEADALATAFYVLGVAASIDFCRQHPGVSAVIMSPVAGSSRVELTLVGIHHDDLRIYDDESISIRPVEA